VPRRRIARERPFCDEGDRNVEFRFRLRQEGLFFPLLELAFDWIVRRVERLWVK